MQHGKSIYDEILERVAAGEDLESLDVSEPVDDARVRRVIAICVNELLSPAASTPKIVAALEELLIRKVKERTGDLWNAKKVL